MFKQSSKQANSYRKNELLGSSGITFFILNFESLYTFASDKNLIIFLSGHYHCLLVTMETNWKLFLHAQVCYLGHLRAQVDLPQVDGLW